MRLKFSLFRNFGAGSLVQLSNLLYKLLQVPVLITALGVAEYGRWLVISSLPTMFALANFGFGSVAANDMVMATADGNKKEAASVFSTSQAMFILIAILGLISILSISPFISWENLINVDITRHNELQKTAIFLTVSMLISFSGDLYGGRLRAANKAYISIAFGGVRPWFDFFALIITLRYSKNFDSLALAVTVSTLLYLFVYQFFSWFVNPEIKFKFKDINVSYIRRLFYKGFYFQLLSIGNSLLMQGNLLIVQLLLGPVEVVIFSTVRTLINSVNQAMGMINQITWPEFSYLFGSSDFVRAARLHRIGSLISASIAIVGFIVLSLVGTFFIQWWTKGAVHIQEHLLIIFLLVIPLTASYACSCAVLAACNKHEGLAISYLIGTVLSLISCYLLTLIFGIEGAALSLVVVNLVSVKYVFKQALLLTNDTWIQFRFGIKNEFLLFIHTSIKFFNKSFFNK
jgi:O-antigen/teichoic acid export membrane protein